MEDTEVLNKIFENKNNTVTLTLGDYESIKAVFEENKSLKEERAELKDSLLGLGRIFIKAQVPESVLKDIKEGKVEVTSRILKSPDKDTTTYAIYIDARNREL